MSEGPVSYEGRTLDPRILTVRGHQVVLDSDLAQIYGVPTKALNQAVKRNRQKFPPDFMFQLMPQEVVDLRSQLATSSGAERYAPQHIANEKVNLNRSQIVTGSQKHRDRRAPPYAFTEHGALMAATVLSSPRAVQMSVFVVRAFVRMRAALTDNRGLARKLAALEKELKSRLDVHESAIVDILRRIMDLIAPPALPEPPRKPIGFSLKESRTAYRTRRTGRR